MGLGVALVVSLFTVGPFAAAASAAGAIASIHGEPVQELTDRPVIVGAPLQGSGAACSLGETGMPSQCFCGGLFPYQTVHVLLRPSECSGCAAARLTTTHVSLGFWGAQSATVSVRIVAAHGDPACPGPDVSTELCPAASYVLSPPGAGLYAFALPLPEGCCIDGDAFLEVAVSGDSPSLDLVTTPSLDACRTYLDGTRLTNWTCPAVPCSCSWPATCISGGSAVMSVDADCCEPTGTPPRSWGRLKATFRLSRE